MKLLLNRALTIFPKQNKFLRIPVLVLFVFVFFFELHPAQGGTLQDQIKRLTSALSSRNLDSLRLMIDPNRIYVEIGLKEGAYLTPSQTLGVVESFFRNHPPVSFSFLLVKEEGSNGIALGTLVVSENSAKISHKVNFGFQKNNRAAWLLSKINIR